MFAFDTIFPILLSILFVVSLTYSYNLGRLAGSLLFIAALTYSYLASDILSIVISCFALLSITQEFIAERRGNKTMTQRLQGAEGAKIRIQAGVFMLAIGFFGIFTCQQYAPLIASLVVLAYGIYQLHENKKLPTMTQGKHNK